MSKARRLAKLERLEEGQPAEKIPLAFYVSGPDGKRTLVTALPGYDPDDPGPCYVIGGPGGA